MNYILLTIIVIIYLLSISYLAWRGYKTTKTAADYMVAGRGVHPYIMALSYGATFISTSAIVGFGGVAGLFGSSLLWLTFLNIAAGIFIAFVFFGKRTRAMSHHLNAHTFPEFIGRRFQSKFIQVASGVIILTMVLYASAVLIGAARHLEGIMGISFQIALFSFIIIITAYVIAGGLKGVMYTDALQGSIMFVGMVILLVITLIKVGGFTSANKSLETRYKEVTSVSHLEKHVMRIVSETIGADQNISKTYFDTSMKVIKTVANDKKVPKPVKIKAMLGGISKIKIEGQDIAPEKYKKIFSEIKPYYLQFLILNGLKKGGHQGWNKMPKAKTPIWWVIVSTIILGVGIGVLAQPQLSVRFMTVKSNRELNRSVLIGGVFILVMTGVAFTVGTLSNEYFFKTFKGLSAIGVAQGNSDKVIPLFLKSAMPSWFNYLFLLTLLSAAMSTLSSQFHTMGTAISRDIAEATGLVKDKDQIVGKKSILTAKLGVGVMIIITLIISFVLPGGVIAAATAIFFGLCAAAFLPSLIGALYWKRATKAGALTSIISGFIITVFWLFFVHASTLKKLGLKSILGNSSLANVDPLFIGFPISLIVFIAVSLLTKPFDEKHLKDCFK